MEHAKQVLKEEFEGDLVELDLFLSTLEDLRACPPTSDLHHGICHHWAQQVNLKRSERHHPTKTNVYSLVGYLAQSWEHTVNPDDDTWYPVPENPRQHKWEGDNLTMRLSLMDHMLTCLRTYRADLTQGS